MNTIRALPVASLALIGAANTAHAQSGVSLFGLIDTSITYINHANASGNSQLGVGGGNLLGSRWGLTGAEDLGGGLKAIFTIENGFNPNTGALGEDGRIFGRQSFVGLASARLGSITIGRQYDALVDVAWPVTASYSFGSVYATPGDVDNYDTSSRTSNAIKYTSPTLAGFTFVGMYALGGIAGKAGAGQTWSAGLSYGNGPLSLAGGYFHAENPAASGKTRDAWGGTSDGTFDGSLVNGAYASAKSIDIARAAVQYASGPLTVGVDYSNARYTPDAFSTFRTTERYDTGRGFVNYRATQALLVGVGYSYTKACGDASAAYHQVSAGADYVLSQRTDLYLVGAWQRASGTQRTLDGGTQRAQASIGSYGYGGTDTQSIVNVGMRHRF
ncbi:porin [Burkholderia thailandensis]|uniref:porin n=1 Tax=Burkholderia thailandensis TaxID=57975 RepID=UPI00016A4B3E|nr:porin [Burkholderia thailandensis]AIP61964.1 porin [Burkholderia thailandensis]AOI51837.1 porin [Burkholderia thailandensis]